MRNTVASTIREAEQTLRTAKIGLLDLCGSCRARRLPGLRNLLVFGQAVVDTLGQGDMSDKEFGPWFECQRQVIESEPLMQHMAEISRVVLAGMELPGYSSVSPKFKPTEIARLGRAPAAAKSFFLGDNILGSGWVIGFNDGREERYFTELPEMLSFDELTAELPVASDRSLQLPLEELCAFFFARLERLVADARRKFLSG